ncbi:MAG: hypothetical protein ACE5HX_03735 [bacterium]
MESNLIHTIEFKSPIVTDVTFLFEKFLDAEQHLFDRHIDDFRYWHFIRFSFLNEIFAAKKWITRETRLQQASLFDKFTMALELIKNSLLYSIARDDGAADLLILNSPNKIQVDRRYMEPYTDTWLSDISYSFTLWEAPLMWRHKKHGLNPKLFYLDSLHLKSLINRALSKKFQQSIHRETTYLVEFAKQFNVALSESKISQLINNVVSLSVCCSNTIESQLKKKQVKLIILVNHYDPLKMLITSIAKSLGIYVVELQHGNMGRYHIAYNFNRTEALDALPNEIFTFGKFWNDTSRIAQTGVKLTIVGMPFFEEKTKQTAESKKDEKIRILILSQDTVSQRLAEIAVKLSNELDAKKYEIIYKLHPREYDSWKIRYPKKFISSNIKVYSEVDLYTLFQQSDIHIGIYSTTIMESLAFNKKLILIESYGVHLYTDLIKKGRAILASNVNDILSAIQSVRKSNLASEDIAYYWQKKSKEKILQRIDEILA